MVRKTSFVDQLRYSFEIGIKLKHFIETNEKITLNNKIGVVGNLKRFQS
jgi:hypothetical protein